MNQEIADQDLADRKDYVEVSRFDLPLHCSMPNDSLWDSHPRVFLAIEKTGEEKCPYCGTEYRLIAEE